MHNPQKSLLALACVLFVASFFLPAAIVPGWEGGWGPIPGVGAAILAYMYFTASPGEWQFAFSKLLSGDPVELLLCLAYPVILSPNVFMLVAPWVVLKIRRRRSALIFRLFNIIAIAGALLPFIVPGLVVETRSELLIGYYAWACSFLIIFLITFLPTRRKTLGVEPTGNPSKVIGIVLLLTLSGGLPVYAQNFNEVVYLCADWGPAMKLPEMNTAPAQFSDTEDEVYFLKQVDDFRRQNSLIPDPLSGRKTQDTRQRLSVFLCKMKPDGSGKTEIRELWRDPNHPIDVQSQATWMDVNEKTHTVALSITLAGSDITGLWTMKLDGGDLKRIITPEVTGEYLQAINKPSWTPDGKWIVFEEELRGTNPNQHRIVKCDREGKTLLRLTQGPKDMQPDVSPDGKQILYIHGIKSATRLYLMTIDGDNQHPLPNPDDKRWGTHGGTWPVWSPDGSRIAFTGLSRTVVEVATGKPVRIGRPGGEGTWGWPQWGRSGMVGHAVRGIILTDRDLREARVIGKPRIAECGSPNSENCRW